jgi:hypothetical protein
MDEFEEVDENEIEDMVENENNDKGEISYKTIINFITNSNLSANSPQLKGQLTSFVCETLGVNLDRLTTKNRKTIKQKIYKFLQTFRFKLRATKNSRHIEFMLQDDWAKSSIKFNLLQKNQRKAPKEGSKPAGRKPMPFELKKRRSQLALAQEICKKYPQGAIKLAFEQGLKIDGQESPKKKNLAFVIKKCSSSTGLTACIAKKAICLRKEVIKKTPEQALFFILTNGLSKQQYKNLKKNSKESGYDIWPNYDYVRDAKKNLRPEGISFEEDGSITVPLQELLEKTLSRTLLNNTPLFDKLLDLSDECGGQLHTTFIFKFGFDSSGAHEVVQQPNVDGDHRQEKHLMASQLVPLQLAIEEDGEMQSLYDFPGPNSPHSCRPIRLAYEKENNLTSIKEYNRLKNEISNLQEYVVHDEPKVTVSFKGLCTLVDGKVVCAVTGFSSDKCIHCGKGRKELREKDSKFEPNVDSFQFGCSILHFGIRTFETLLKIGYKKELKKFTAQEAKMDSLQFKEKFSKGEMLVKKRF